MSITGLSRLLVLSLRELPRSVQGWGLKFVAKQKDACISIKRVQVWPFLQILGGHEI